jgi:mannose-6-phosphate isomerase-like protein (cupin superfamily)
MLGISASRAQTSGETARERGFLARVWADAPRSLANSPLFNPAACDHLSSAGHTEGLPMIDRTEPLKVTLAERLETFDDVWAPKIIARYNDNEVRLVKTEGEWVWHKHDETDELFLILEGEFDMDFRDRTIVVGPGELLIVPRGVEHRPAARRGLVKLLLIDPDGTPNTGDHATATPAVEL